MIGSQSERDDFIGDLTLEADEDIVSFLTRQTSYPAINIGQLGVLEGYQGMGIGSMIIDLVADTYTKYRQAGCQFITVDALNNDLAIKFYHKNSFGVQTYRDSTFPTRRMYRIL